MPLEPRLARLVRLANATDRTDRAVPIATRREQDARLARAGWWLLLRAGPRAVTESECEVPVDGGVIRVRLYRPAGRGRLPLHVFFHGGGFCVGTLDERDPRCRTIAAGAGCVVASVEYRLAPENRFPTAPEDCYAALCALVERAAELDIDATRVSVGGESAGANLAAVVCLLARDRSGPAICHQWLDVPSTDATLSQSGFAEVPDGYLLDRAAIDEFLAHYLPDPATDALDPRCSPLFAPSHADLPSAWIMSAEFDQLRGDATAYAAALEGAGVAVTHVRLDGHIHPSFAFTRLLASARRYEADAIDALAAAYAR